MGGGDVAEPKCVAENECVAHDTNRCTVSGWADSVMYVALRKATWSLIKESLQVNFSERRS